MALIGNFSVYAKSPARFICGSAGAAGSIEPALKTNFGGISIFRSRDFNMNRTVAYPVGYRAGSAYYMPTLTGGLGATTTLAGTGSLTAAPLSVRRATATIPGVGSVSASLRGTVAEVAALAGVGSISAATLSAVGRMIATLSGVGTVSTARLNSLTPISAALSGTGSLTAAQTGSGSMQAHIEVGTGTGLSASQVWEFDTSNITETGTAGKRLNDASAGTNPWDELTTSHTTSGTFGSFIQKLLTVAKFLGLK